jgi:hypothetical protein
MKCLPQNKISQAQGVTIHDWHAEILTIRSLNRVLLDECHELAKSYDESNRFIRRRSREETTENHFQPFALNDEISLHMYCSEAPCEYTESFLIRILIVVFRWRRKHGTRHGIPRRFHPLGPARTLHKQLPIDHFIQGLFPTPWPRLLFCPRSSETQALPPRRPTNPLKILLRQARPQAINLSSLLSHLPAHFSPKRLPHLSRLAIFPTLRNSVHASFLFFRTPYSSEREGMGRRLCVPGVQGLDNGEGICVLQTTSSEAWREISTE